MRSDRVVDGLAVGRTSVGGDDASSFYCRALPKAGTQRRQRDDGLGGDPQPLQHHRHRRPVAEDQAARHLPDLQGDFRNRGFDQAHFPEGAEAKLEAYRKLGGRKRLKLKSGHSVFARTAGMDDTEAKSVIEVFTLQGSVPEPVRVARLLARAVAPRPPSRRG